MQRDIDQINVIPLVDVMLVLLVIVLTTATFISSGQIPVNLAKAKEVGTRKDAPIIITLTADGALFLNDRTVPEGGLPGALTAEPRESAVVVRRIKSPCSNDSCPWWMKCGDWDFNKSAWRSFVCDRREATSTRSPERRSRPGMARLHLLARHSSCHSDSAHEAGPTRAA